MLIKLVLLSSLIQFSDVRCDVLFPFGPRAGDSPVSVTGNTTYFHSHKRFRIFGKRFKNLYICSNGFVALGKPYCEENPISYADGHALLAPFWIAQDTSPDQDSTAKIWYRTTREQSILNDAANQLSGYFDDCKPADFRPRELLIVTWSNVRQIDTCLARGINPDRCHCLFDQPEYLDPRRMSRYCDCIKRQEPEEYCRCEALVKDTTLCRRTAKGKMDHSNTKRDVGGGGNTYQLVIASDKTNTFVIFSYDNIEWISSNQFATDGTTNEEYPVTYKAFVGFISKRRAFYILPESGSDDLYNLNTQTNINKAGVHVYKVNGPEVQGTECDNLSPAKQAVLYPFGPDYGDRAGPALGQAHLVFDNGIPYYNKSYHDVWASSYGAVSFATERVPLLADASTPAICVYLALQDLRSPYQSDDIYTVYYTDYDPAAMLSSRFWYRVTSDPLLLARAQLDLQQVADPDFVPNSVAVITWYRSQIADQCAWHGFRPDFCECMFVSNNDTRCACLIWWLLDHVAGYENYYFAAMGYCNSNEDIKESDIFLKSGPYTEENTYQAVLVTDSVDTYVLLHYSDITWYKYYNFIYNYRYGPRYPAIYIAVVEIHNGTEDTVVAHPFSASSKLLSLPTESNVGVPGRFVYKVSEELTDL